MAPHHAPDDGFHEQHYFVMSGDEHHYAWFDVLPSAEGPIVIKYDYRDYEGYSNLISAAEIAAAELALAE